MQQAVPLTVVYSALA